MDFVYGDILTNNGFKKGFIKYIGPEIIEISFSKPKNKPKIKGIILPTLINSHTHIGDYFIKKSKINIPRNLDEMVKPPDGIKHLLLEKSSEIEIINGMKSGIKIMTKFGISKFYDFREGGLIGINQLKNALRDYKNISSMILSRPKNHVFNKDEINLILNNSDGIGLSGISDWDYSEIIKVAKLTKIKKKIFAIHASEKIRENIDKIIDLKPDFLIHMNQATESDLNIVKENEIPIVICPRSNKFFRLKTNYDLMEKLGINLMLGTDNSMINSPNILTELKYYKKISGINNLEKLLNMITYNPRKVLNLDYNILDLKLTKDLIILDYENLNPHLLN